MTTAPRLLASDARHKANCLPDVLHRERIAARAAATEPSVLEPCEIDATHALIEQAKDALMLHFWIDSHQALAVPVGWARTSGTPVPTVAQTLLRGICEGSPHTEARQRPLTRWLEAQLRDGSRPSTTPDGSGHRPVAGRPMRLRARAECGNGGVQGRDSRSHASLHHATPTCRAATPRHDLSR